MGKFEIMKKFLYSIFAGLLLSLGHSLLMTDDVLIFLNIELLLDVLAVITILGAFKLNNSDPTIKTIDSIAGSPVAEIQVFP